MKLPSFPSKHRTVNLLPHDSFETSLMGTILTWSLTFGKWVVIITQLVVTVAFLSRFGYDRQLTDLRKQIAQEVAIIRSYEQIEQDFVLAQKRVMVAEPIIAQNATYIQVIDKLEGYTPTDVWFDRLSVTPTSLNMTAYAKSLPGFSQFLTSLQHDPYFKSIAISTLGDGTKGKARLQFELSLQFAGEQNKQ